MKKLILNKILNLFFTKDKTKLFLIIALILAFILRFWIAFTAQPFADDLVYGTHAINFLSSGATSNQNQSPLWFSLADVFYKLFGVTLVTGRLTSIIFGALSILVTFLIANLLFDKRVAIISAFLLTISSFHIKHPVMEMDMTFTFFALFSIYLFLEKLIKENKISLLAFLFLGLAILSKSIPVTVIPGLIFAFIIFFLSKKTERKELLSKKNIKYILIGALILFISAIPILSYNYLLFKEKGLLDVMFARFLDIGMNTFSSIEATLPSFTLSMFFNQGIKATLYNFFFLNDLIILPLSLVGLIIALRKKFVYSSMLLSTFLFTYIFLSGTSLLSNHFVFAPVIYSIFAALPIDYISKKIKFKYIIPIILLLILIVNIYTLSPLLFSRSPTGQLREFANKEIDDNSLVIMDDRIYRGLTAWTMNDKHYLEATLLGSISEQNNQIDRFDQQINTFFVECVPDNCGWASISPGLHESMENLISQLNEPIKTIYGGGGDREPTEPYFNIYLIKIALKPEILDLVDKTHFFFFYPVRWELKDEIYDSYTPKGFIDNSIDLLAHLILYLSILLALLSPIYLFYKVYETFKKSELK